MTLVTYSGDYDVTATFDASFIPAESWNGAAMPFFPLAEAVRLAILQAVQRFDDQYRWNADIGNFELDESEDMTEPRKWVPVETMLIDGETHYRMGHYWTWAELDTTDPEYPALAAMVARAKSNCEKYTLEDYDFPYSP